MDLQTILDEVKIKLTGGILELELDDAQLTQIINTSLREMNRYYCSTKFITLPYSKCIDLNSVSVDGETKELKINSIISILRPEGVITSSEAAMSDPMVVSQWQMLSPTGNMSNFSDYIYNYMSWNTMKQLRNTISTDLAFTYDRDSNKLYINSSTTSLDKITIEYIPRLCDVSEVNSDYWIDVLVSLAVAQTKIILGRIRSRFKQSNALWAQDGESILQEGLNEYNNLVNYLK